MHARIRITISAGVDLKGYSNAILKTSANCHGKAAKFGDFRGVVNNVIINIPASRAGPEEDRYL
jgi:hypothetical protein